MSTIWNAAKREMAICPDCKAVLAAPVAARRYNIYCRCAGVGKAPSITLKEEKKEEDNEKERSIERER